VDVYLCMVIDMFNWVTNTIRQTVPPWSIMLLAKDAITKQHYSGSYRSMLLHSIQFNSIQKLYLKMVTQYNHNLSSLGPSKHVNNTTIVHTYIQNNTGSSDKHRQTQLTLSYKNISINTYTMYTQTCTFTTLYHLCIKWNNT